MDASIIELYGVAVSSGSTPGLRTPHISCERLVDEMIEADHTPARKGSLVKMAGFQALDHPPSMR